MTMWPSVGPMIRGRGLPLLSSHTAASLPHTLLAARKAEGLGHSVGLWHWARLTGPHGDQACSPDLSEENQRWPSQFHSCWGLWIPGLCVSDSILAHGALLLFPFPLVSPVFRNSVIHRLLLGLLLGEIKDHQLLGALLTATETFQRWPLCPCWTPSQQASSSDSPIPYCLSGQKKCLNWPQIDPWAVPQGARKGEQWPDSSDPCTG